MKYEVIVSPENEEKIIIYVKDKTPLVEKIISLVEEDTQQFIGFSTDEAVILSPDEIECITVIGGKTTAITQRGDFVLKERLYLLEECLKDDFLRINKSSLANIKKIHSFSASFGGALMIRFKCGFCDYVSRRQCKYVKEKLK